MQQDNALFWTSIGGVGEANLFSAREWQYIFKCKYITEIEDWFEVWAVFLPSRLDSFLMYVVQVDCTWIYL